MSWKAPIFDDSHIPHLFMVHNTRSHKSVNISTTWQCVIFRSLDDFPVPVKQCRFKVYLDNLEFSCRKQIVVKPTNSYKSLNKCQELLCLHGKHNAFANTSFSMVFYVFLLGLENYQNPYKNKHFEKSISSQSLSVHLSACCLPANQSGYAIAIADETADDIDNDKTNDFVQNRSKCCWNHGKRALSEKWSGLLSTWTTWSTKSSILYELKSSDIWRFTHSTYFHGSQH